MVREWGICLLVSREIVVFFYRVSTPSQWRGLKSPTVNSPLPGVSRTTSRILASRRPHKPYTPIQCGTPTVRTQGPRVRGTVSRKTGVDRGSITETSWTFVKELLFFYFSIQFLELVILSSTATHPSTGLLCLACRGLAHRNIPVQVLLLPVLPPGGWSSHPPTPSPPTGW